MNIVFAACKILCSSERPYTFITDRRGNSVLAIYQAGILTDNPELVELAMNQFDAVWIGKHCARCKRKAFCGDPIA